VLASAIETEIAGLAMRYGQPHRVAVELTGAPFSPLILEDRHGEVCMVVRRPCGKLITAIKTFYPVGAFRLLTGGVGHGEPIAAALLREVAEETGLDVVVRRFLAVIEYYLASGEGDKETRRQGELLDAPSPPLLVSPSPPPAFATFAFLLDETGGTLQPQDAGERIEAFHELAIADLPALAETLENVPDTYDEEIDGSWRDWGRFRAVAHRVVYAALTSAED
jgi:8-oxo-dGTP pyrophosphatase MutT (NUDIX family)